MVGVNGEREDATNKNKWGRSCLLYGGSKSGRWEKGGQTAASPDHIPDHPGWSGGKPGPGQTESGAVRGTSRPWSTPAQRGVRPDPVGPSSGQSGGAEPGRTESGVVRCSSTMSSEMRLKNPSRGRTAPDQVRGGPEKICATQ
jgi:hypothetical protein